MDINLTHALVTAKHRAPAPADIIIIDGDRWTVRDILPTGNVTLTPNDVWDTRTLETSPTAVCSANAVVYA